MSKTLVSLGELKQEIPHLHQKTREGYSLVWGEAPETRFGIEYKGDDIETLKSVDRLLTEAYHRAQTVLG